MHDGGGDGLVPAQGREGGLGGGADAVGLAGGGLGAGGVGGAFAELFLGRGAGLVGLFPAAVEEQALGMAQVFADLAVAGGLAGLTFELGQLGGELFDDVVDAGEVLFGAVQLQLGLVSALVEPGNAGGLFEDAAAGLGLGVDQLGNLALPDKRRGMGAGGRVGEEHLHVAGADILAVDLVGGAHVAGDAADDFEMVGFVEAGGR